MYNATHPIRAASAPELWREILARAALDRLLRLEQQRENDSDLDGVPDVIDNCPHCYNPNQYDFDLDGIGDCCDPDTDNDSDPNPLDPRLFDPTVKSFEPSYAVRTYGTRAIEHASAYLLIGAVIDIVA